VADPLVTVWIPSYNHGRWLSEAIESALGQTYSSVEVVIVDDSSSDNSLEIAESYAAAHPERVRVLTHPGGENRGLPATANLALEHTRGVYWAGLPSDDLLSLDMVERNVEVLEADPALLFAYGYARAVDAAGTPIGRDLLIGENINRHPRPLERLLHANWIPGMAVLVRHEALSRLVPRLYDETLVYCDWDVWIRLVAHGPVAFLPRVVANYRVHGANLTIEHDGAVARRRSLDVLRTIENDADEIGAALTRPRIRAALRLELALRCYRDGALDEADHWIATAFTADPSIEGDAEWLKTWLLERLSRTTPPDDMPGWMLARAPAPVRAALARPFAALRLEQEARAAEHRGRRFEAWRLAGRSLRLEPSRAAHPAFLRFLAKLVLGRRLVAITRRLRGQRRARDTTCP
jgi:alpha-1,3-rhamnosyltransferase